MTRRGLVLFALMAVIWGIPYLFIRVAVAEITPATLVLARTAIAAAILLPYAIARVDLRAVLARWRWVVAFAAVEIAIPWVALGSAEQKVTSSLAGLLIAGVPLVGLGFGAGRTRLDLRELECLGRPIRAVTDLLLAPADPVPRTREGAFGNREQVPRGGDHVGPGTRERRRKRSRERVVGGLEERGVERVVGHAPRVAATHSDVDARR